LVSSELVCSVCINAKPCFHCRGAQKAHRAFPNEALYCVLIYRLITWTYLPICNLNEKGLAQRRLCHFVFRCQKLTVAATTFFASMTIGAISFIFQVAKTICGPNCARRQTRLIGQLRHCVDTNDGLFEFHLNAPESDPIGSCPSMRPRRPRLGGELKTRTPHQDVSKQHQKPTSNGTKLAKTTQSI
jgi:hypothetical protein